MHNIHLRILVPVVLLLDLNVQLDLQRCSD